MQAVTPPSLPLEKFAETSLLHEALGQRGAMHHDIRPVYAGAKFFGRALTVRSKPGDNLMLHLAIAAAQPGDVLVVDAGGYVEAGCWGEIASVAAQVRGVVALVLDGSVRDVDAIARLGFPVFSRGISMKGTSKRCAGALHQPVCVGGVTVNPGDYVVGDSDGVVVVPDEQAQAVAERAAAIRAREAEMMRRIKEGELTVDLLGLRPVLKELNLSPTGPDPKA